MCRSHTYAGKNTAEYKCGTVHGIFKRKKFLDCINNTDGCERWMKLLLCILLIAYYIKPFNKVNMIKNFWERIGNKCNLFDIKVKNKNFKSGDNRPIG